MSVQLPINMLPISPSAAKAGGFVVVVLIGLALFAGANKNRNKPTAG